MSMPVVRVEGGEGYGSHNVLTGARLRCNENTNDSLGSTDLFEIWPRYFRSLACTHSREAFRQSLNDSSHQVPIPWP